MSKFNTDLSKMRNYSRNVLKVEGAHTFTQSLYTKFEYKGMNSLEFQITQTTLDTPKVLQMDRRMDGWLDRWMDGLLDLLHLKLHSL